MTHYYDNQVKTIEYQTDGRMSLSEVIGVLSHLNNDYQRPWINALRYSYDGVANLTYVIVTVTNDRPHNVSMGGSSPARESGKPISGSTGSNKD